MPKKTKKKNSKPSSYFAAYDKCPSCGTPCHVEKDLDEYDYCNICRPTNIKPIQKL